MQKLSCVVPAYNEAESLPFLWAKLKPVLESLGTPWEVLVVNDGSTDATAKIVNDLHQQDQRIRLVNFSANRGKSYVLMAGFRAATGDVVVTLDADLQDDPNEIPNLLKEMETAPADMVGGWKKERHDPFIKLVSSKVFNGIANRMMRTKFHDLNCGLKAYRKEVVDSLNLYGDMYRFIPLLAVANGYRVTEIPVIHHPREHGVSKYGLRLNGAFDLISLLMITRYRFRPLHFFGRWGAVSMLVGFGLFAYLAVLHFQGQAIGSRPLLTFAGLFVLTGLQMIFTGLLADLVINNRQSRS